MITSCSYKINIARFFQLCPFTVYVAYAQSTPQLVHVTTTLLLYLGFQSLYKQFTCENQSIKHFQNFQTYFFHYCNILIEFYHCLLCFHHKNQQQQRLLILSSYLPLLVVVPVPNCPVLQFIHLVLSLNRERKAIYVFTSHKYPKTKVHVFKQGSCFHTKSFAKLIRSCF